MSRLTERNGGTKLTPTTKNQEDLQTVAGTPKSQAFGILCSIDEIEYDLQNVYNSLSVYSEDVYEEMHYANTAAEQKHFFDRYELFDAVFQLSLKGLHDSLADLRKAVNDGFKLIDIRTE